MSLLRVEVRSRGASLLVAHLGSLSAAERARCVPQISAQAELEWLDGEGRGRLVAAYAARFPNSSDAELERQVMGYVGEQVALGALSVARLG